MIFLSRVMRKKNLKWLLENIGVINGKLEIDILGPIEDEVYWDEIQSVINKLPENIKVEYKGYVAHEKVLEEMFNYHFFLLPTLGENFGHVFVEALSVGCPLVISDRTPWVDLETKKVGWDIPLENSDMWTSKINYCIGLDDITYSALSANAREYATKWLDDPQLQESTLNVLEEALKSI